MLKKIAAGALLAIALAFGATAPATSVSAIGNWPDPMSSKGSISAIGNWPDPMAASPDVRN